MAKCLSKRIRKITVILSYREIDTNNDGCITYRDFEEVMLSVEGS